MLFERKLQAMKNEVQQVENAITQAYAKAQSSGMFAAEKGIENMTKEEQNEIFEALCFITDILEPYRN